LEKEAPEKKALEMPAGRRFGWISRPRWDDWREGAARLAAEAWTPLLPVPLAAAGLAVAVVVAGLRPDRAVVGVVVWAGAVLLATAEPLAAACGISWATPTERRRLRATIAAVTLLAVFVTVVFG
jgi:hypothetical protein